MSALLKYSGYKAKIEYDAEDEILVGTVLGINDSLSFYADNVNKLKKMFKQCINNYFLHCKEIGKTPEKEYSGTFNIRIKPQLHKQITEIAEAEGESMNKVVETAIDNYVRTFA